MVVQKVRSSAELEAQVEAQDEAQVRKLRWAGLMWRRIR